MCEFIFYFRKSLPLLEAPKISGERCFWLYYFHGKFYTEKDVVCIPLVEVWSTMCKNTFGYSAGIVVTEFGSGFVQREN